LYISFLLFEIINFEMPVERKKNLLSDWFIARPKTAGIVVFALLLITGAYITWLSHNITVQTRALNAQEFSRVIQQNIDQALDKCKLAALTLAMTINDKGEVKNFEAVAAELVNSYSSVDAVQLVPQGVIRDVYPFEENKSVIGYNVLNDPFRMKEAIKAIELRKMFFAGPFPLRQGGIGIVGRLPVFIDQEFWGFSAVIIHLNTLLKNAGIDTSNQSGFLFSFSKINPDTQQEEFFLDQIADISSAEVIGLHLQEGEWSLRILPSPSKNSHYGILALAAFSILLSIVSALFVTRLLQKPAALHQLVETTSEELQKSTERNEAILKALPDMMFIMDRSGRFKYHQNPYNMDTLTSPEYFMNKSVREVMPPDLAEEIMHYLSRISPEEPFCLHDYTLSVNDENFKGEKYFEARYALISNDEVLVLVRETTAQKKAEAEILKMNDELSMLSEHLQNVREVERAALSRELHDELGQQLTAINLDLHWIKKNLHESEHLSSHKIDDAISMVQDASATVKRINTELRPSILDDLGLIAAIEWQLNDFSERYGIPAKLTCDCDELNISSSKSIAIFRIIQESLNNIAKHAMAKKVEIWGHFRGTDLVINIKDDGIGFHPEIPSKRVSFGMIGMKERAKMLHANLEIQSVPGRGTTLELSIPVQSLSDELDISSVNVISEVRPGMAGIL
jgi:signal transduction histidine kinase